MPLYNFNCSCGEEFERLCKVGVKTVKCEKCGKRAKKGIIDRISYHKKGRGYKWSQSDYNRVMNEMIDDSKKNLKSTKSPYARYEINPAEAQKNGYRRLTKQELAERDALAKKQAAQFHKNLKRK